MDGIDMTWGRFAGGTPITAMVDEVIAHFDPRQPSASVSGLVKIHRLLGTLPVDSVIEAKRRQLDHILQCCLGIYVQTTLPDSEVVPGETLALQQGAIVRTHVPVRWLGARFPGGNQCDG